MRIFYCEGRRWYAALVLAVSLAIPVHAAAPELPPLNGPLTNTRLPLPLSSSAETNAGVMRFTSVGHE